MFQVLLCPYGYKTCGWQVKLCDPIKHGACLSASSLRKRMRYISTLITLHYIGVDPCAAKFRRRRITPAPTPLKICRRAAEFH